MKHSEKKIKPNTPYIKTWSADEIQVVHVVTNFDDYTNFSASNDKDVVRLHFGIQGDYRFTHQQLGQSYDLVGGHHNIMYSNGIGLEIENKTLSIETFGIEFPKSLFLSFVAEENGLLASFSNQVLKGESAILAQNWGTLSPKIQSVIDEIANNPFQGMVQQVFLTAKSLELLVLCAENYTQNNQRTVPYLKKVSDKEKIIAARDYINHQYAQAPSLTEIAKAVGINEYKLKKGFKEMFQSTVFGYLTQKRLSLAKQYLLNTEKTAAQISLDLGYSSPQHFSNQFKQHFGITPNAIRNNP